MSIQEKIRIIYNCKTLFFSALLLYMLCYTMHDNNSEQVTVLTGTSFKIQLLRLQKNSISDDFILGHCTQMKPP